MKNRLIFGLLAAAGLFLATASTAGATNYMWTLHNRCEDIGSTNAWTATAESNCVPGKRPNGTTAKCCSAASDTPGCCQKTSPSGGVTTANLSGETCQKIDYATTAFYQDQEAANNRCATKPSTLCSWRGLTEYYDQTMGGVISTDGGCQAGESIGTACTAAKPDDTSNFGVGTRYQCCCAAPIVTAIPPKFTIPVLQIPIDTLTLSAPVCANNLDGSFVCQIPWLSQYILAIYNYGLSVAGILAAIVLMAGGLLWLVSAGDASKITQAKELIAGSVTGLIILASSYIILIQINPELVQLAPVSIGAIKDMEPVSSEGNPNNTSACINCVELDSRIAAKNGRQLSSALNNKLLSALSAPGSPAWRVTEAYPPSSSHQSTCHYNGACVDVALTGGRSCADVAKLVAVMQGAGFRVLNEYVGCSGGTQTSLSTGGHLHLR